MSSWGPHKGKTQMNAAVQLAVTMRRQGPALLTLGLNPTRAALDFRPQNCQDHCMWLVIVHGELCLPPREAHTGKAAPQAGCGVLQKAPLAWGRGQLSVCGEGTAVLLGQKHRPCCWGSRWLESSGRAMELGRWLSASVGRTVGAL